MTLELWTSRISTRDPDAFNITRKSATDGIVFAPSWAILTPALEAMRRATRVGRENPKEATRIREVTWTRYAVDYRQEMRDSYAEHRAAWDALLARPRVVMVCYCVDAAHCHRLLLAGYLGRLGAAVRGELK